MTHAQPDFHLLIVDTNFITSPRVNARDSKLILQRWASVKLWKVGRVSRKKILVKIIPKLCQPKRCADLWVGSKTIYLWEKYHETDWGFSYPDWGFSYPEWGFCNPDWGFSYPDWGFLPLLRFFLPSLRFFLPWMRFFLPWMRFSLPWLRFLLPWLRFVYPEWGFSYPDWGFS
jgi:hypothetical protein